MSNINTAFLDGQLSSVLSESNHEKQKLGKEAYTIIGTLKKASHAMSEAADFINHSDQPASSDIKNIMSVLKDVLAAMQEKINSIEEKMIQSQEKQMQRQLEVGQTVLQSLKKALKHLIEEIKKIEHEIKEEKKKRKWLKDIGIGVAVAGIAAGVITGQVELVVVSAALLTLSETGTMEKMQKGLTSFYVDTFGVSETTGRILADVTIIVAMAALSAGMGAGVGAASGGGEAATEATTEAGSEEGGIEMTNFAEGESASETASESRAQAALKRLWRVAMMGGAQAMTTVDLAKDIVASMHIKNEKEKVAVLAILETLQAALAMYASYKAASGLDSPVMEALSERSTMFDVLARNSGRIMAGTAAVQGSGMGAEGGLTASLAVTKLHQAKHTKHEGDDIAEEKLLEFIMQMNRKGMENANKFTESLEKEFGSMRSNTNAYGDPMQAVADVLASVSA